MPLASNSATCPQAPRPAPCLILCTLTSHFCVSCVHVFRCMFFVWYVVFCSCVCMFLVACFWLHVSGCMSFVWYVVFWCCVCMSLAECLSLHVFRFICRIFLVLCVVCERTAAADERAASCSGSSTLPQEAWSPPRCLRQALCTCFSCLYLFSSSRASRERSARDESGQNIYGVYLLSSLYFMQHTDCRNLAVRICHVFQALVLCVLEKRSCDTRALVIWHILHTHTRGCGRAHAHTHSQGRTESL